MVQNDPHNNIFTIILESTVTIKAVWMLRRRLIMFIQSIDRFELSLARLTPHLRVTIGDMLYSAMGQTHEKKDGWRQSHLIIQTIVPETTTAVGTGRVVRRLQVMLLQQVLVDKSSTARSTSYTGMSGTMMLSYRVRYTNISEKMLWAERHSEPPRKHCCPRILYHISHNSDGPLSRGNGLTTPLESGRCEYRPCKYASGDVWRLCAAKRITMSCHTRGVYV